MAKNSNRQSNIELLRILTMVGIIVLHFNHPDMGGGFFYVQNPSINGGVLYFLEALFCGGVDLFLMITGYFMCERSSVKMSKALDLLLQVVLYSVGGYLLMVVAAGRVFSTSDFAAAFVPNNYFVILYLALFLFIPYINIMVKQLSDRKLKNLLVSLTLVFGLWPMLADVLELRSGMTFAGLSSIGIDGDQAGYTIVTFLICYLFGAYVRRIGSGSGRHGLFYLLCVIIICLWSYAGACLDLRVTALHYNNPVILILAYCLLRWFLSVDIGTKRTVNLLANGTFGVFLLHSAFLSFLPTERMVSMHPVMMTAAILICAVVIYLVCWIATFVYQKIYDRTIARLTVLADRIKLGV